MDWLYLILIGYALGTVGLYSATVFRVITEAAKGAVIFCVCALLFDHTGWYLAATFGAYVLGRRFPIYRRFNRVAVARGAPAIEAGAAFLLSIVLQAAVSGTVLPAVVVIMIAVAALLSVTRAWQVPILSVSILAGFFLPLAESCGGLSPATVLVSGYLAFEAVISIVTSSLFKLGESGEVKLWRLLARPFALLFLPIDVFAGRRTLLFVIGIVALVFIITDFVRLATKKNLAAVFKKKEANRFSSMTLFLVSAFLSFLLFPASIPYVSFVCITFGDLFSKVIGLRFGTLKLYKSRTLEGTLAFLAGSLMFNVIISAFVEISLVYIIVGCFIAAITELFSGAIDDNFSVTIVTGGVLVALRYFLRV